MNLNIETVMERWSDTIAKELAERKLYNMADVRAYAHTRLKEAVKDCISIQLDELDAKRLELVKKVNQTNITFYTKQKYQAELAQVNKLIKERQLASREGDWSEEKKAEHRKSMGVHVKNGANVIVGRLTEILPIDNYKGSLFSGLVIALSYNKKIPFNNESNFAKITLRNERIKEIENYSIGDVLAIEFVLSCDKFTSIDKTVFIHNIMPTKISKVSD